MVADALLSSLEICRSNMRLAALATALLLLFASPTSSQPPTIIEKAHRSVVAVTAPTQNDQSIYCTGVQIGIIRVLTAEHCVPDNNDGVLINGSPAKVIKKDAWLALLETPPAHSIIELAPSNPPVGTDVATIGLVDSSGTRLTLKRGVAGFNIHGVGMFIDGPLVQGMSGGPVVDDHGHLVGINQATNQWTGLVSTVKEIREFLK